MVRPTQWRAIRRGFVLPRPIKLVARQTGEGRDWWNGVRVSQDVNHDRRTGCERCFYCRRNILRTFYTNSLNPTRLCNRRMINGHQIADIGVTPEASVFRVPLVAENCVVHYRNHNSETLAARCLQLGPDMAKTTVSDNAEYRSVRLTYFRPERQGESPSEASLTSRCDEASIKFGGEIVRDPDRRKTRVGYDK